MLLPYRKPMGVLENCEVLLEESTREVKIDKRLPAITEKSTQLKLIEHRSGRKNVSAVFDTYYHDMWGGRSVGVLREIVEPLNSKSDYEWKRIEEILVNFLKKEGKYGVFDYSLGCITSFIGEVYRAKWEITRKPLDEPTQTEDHFVKDITFNVFSQPKIFREIENFIKSPHNIEEKGKAIIDIIAKQHRSFFWPYTIIEPDYEEEIKPVYGIELLELYAMEKIFNRELKKIEIDYSTDAEKQRLLRDEFFSTAYYDRIESYERRRVHGGSLRFEEKEERKRIEARKISEELRNILLSWGVGNGNILENSISYYWDLFEEKAWERQKSELQDVKLEEKWKTDLEQIKRTQLGQWDSNTLTLFGVIIAIFFSVLFGLSSVMHINWYFYILIALAISVGLVLIIKIGYFRLRIIKFMTKMLSSAQKSR
jgi:hypothetical protein